MQQMHYKHGLFFPDYFPWQYEHAIAILHKTSVINGMRSQVVLRAVPLMPRWLWRGETAIEEALHEIYDGSPGYLSFTSSLRLAADCFPKSVDGPLKYCAACLTETGFVPAIFALRFVVSCPWHHQPLNPLCERCHDIRKFTPTPFGSEVGYRCVDCGYWVPNRSAIFAICHTPAIHRHELACSMFVMNTFRLHRLAVLDVLHFDKLTDCGAQPWADGGAIPEFVRDATTNIWYKTLELGGPCAAPSSPDESYRRFVDFHQMRLLKAHRDCPCGAVLSRPDFGDASRSMCVYTAALSIFRQKFEDLSRADAMPRLSAQAAQQLAKLQMAPWVAQRFFQCVFYQLVARLWFWSRAASQFFVHIDPRHFFAMLHAGQFLPMLDRLLGERWEGCCRCVLDLPADRAAMRQLMGPARDGQVLRLRNFGTRAELSTSAKSRLFFGSLRATAMFYF